MFSQQFYQLALIAASVFMFFSVHVSAAEESIEKSTIVSSLIAQRRLLSEGLHVRYHVEWNVVQSARSFGPMQIGRVMEGKPFLPFWRAEHAWQGNKRYHVTWGSRKTTIEEAVKEDMGVRTRVFDGNRGFMRMQATGTVTVYQGESVKRDGRHMLPEEDLYRELVGFESLRQDWGITFKGIKNPLPFDIATVIALDEYSVSLSEPNVEHSLLLVQRPDLDQIWLDPAKGFAIVRRIRRWNPGQPTRIAIHNSDFQNLKDEIWLPKTSRFDYYAEPNTNLRGVVVEATLVVDHVSLNPPANLFTMKIPSGTLVDDVQNEFTGVMPASDDSLNEFLDSPELAMKQARLDNRSQWTRGFLLFLGINVLVGLLVLARYLWMRRNTEA